MCIEYGGPPRTRPSHHLLARGFGLSTEPASGGQRSRDFGVLRLLKDIRLLRGRGTERIDDLGGQVLGLRVDRTSAIHGLDQIKTLVHGREANLPVQEGDVAKMPDAASRSRDTHLASLSSVDTHNQGASLRRPAIHPPGRRSLIERPTAGASQAAIIRSALAHGSRPPRPSGDRGNQTAAVSAARASSLKSGSTWRERSVPTASFAQERAFFT